MKTNSPDSTCGRNASCCALLKRCTSSTNTTVGLPPAARAACARSTASRMSLTPPSTAEMAMNSRPKASAISRASVVLPCPAAPQDHRVRAARFEGHAQWLARAEQMGLADHFVEPVRPQPLGQRSSRVCQRQTDRSSCGWRRRNRALPQQRGGGQASTTITHGPGAAQDARPVHPAPPAYQRGASGASMQRIVRTATRAPPSRAQGARMSQIVYILIDYRHSSCCRSSCSPRCRCGAGRGRPGS